MWTWAKKIAALNLRRRRIIVTFNLDPDTNITQKELCDYVRDAVNKHCGGLDPSDPMVQELIDRRSFITVRPANTTE